MSELARRVVDKMMENDRFSQWLGIKIIDIEEGHAEIEMTVRDEMLNGFNIAHGGIVFCLADSALAFATNSYGIRSVSIEASVSWPHPVNSGDIIRAIAEKRSLTSKTALFDVNIFNQKNHQVGLFRGTVYRTGKAWFPEEE